MSKLYNAQFQVLGFFRFFIVILVLCASMNSAKAQWQRIDGFSEGGGSIAIERVGTELWAGSSLGLFKSSDEGNNWILSPDFPNEIVVEIKSYGDTVIVLFKTQYSAGKYYSKTTFNAGVTWSNIAIINDQDISYLDRCEDILRRGNILYVYGDGSSFQSFNFGLSWNIFDNVNLIWFGANECIFTTSENGQIVYKHRNNDTGSLTTINLPDSAYINNWCVINNEIYVTINSSSISSWNLLKTANFGTTWDTLINIPNPTTGFSKFYLINNDFYLYNPNGIYYPNEESIKITGDGSQIDFIVTPDLLHDIVDFTSSNYMDYYDYAYLTNGEILTTGWNLTNYGFRKYNSDMSFNSYSGLGINSSNVTYFEGKDQKFIVSSYDKVQVSFDGMQTWDTLSNLINVKGSLIEGDTMILVGRYNSNYYLVRTFNNGLTWANFPLGSTLSTSLNNYGSNFSLAQLNGILYIEGGINIYYSTNWGMSWAICPNWPASFNNIPYTGSQAGNFKRVGNDIFLALPGRITILKLNQTNNSWEYLYGLSDVNTYFEDHYLYVFDSLVISHSTDHLLYSINQGLDWTTPNMEGVPIRPIFSEKIMPSFIFVDSLVWYGVFDEYGIYFSIDNGDNWAVYDNNIPFTIDGGIFIQDNRIYSGSYNGGLWSKINLLNILSGNVYLDSNNNGIKDTDEHGVSNVLVKASFNNSIVSTHSNGDFHIVGENQNDTLSVIIPLSYVETIPSNQVTNITSNNYLFGIQLEPFNDLSIGITDQNRFRPGFYTNLSVCAQNLGSESIPATIKLLLPNEVSVISSEPNFSSQSGDTLIWNTPVIDFYENYTIHLNVLTSMNTPLGDSLHCFAQISPIVHDSIPSNNTVYLDDVFVGAFDPNDKQCVQGRYVDISDVSNDFELQYIIRFQNTGTFLAENIRIEDQLSAHFQLSSFRIMDNSHDPMHFELSESGYLKIYFDQIQLPDSFSNEPASHGFVKYAIKPKNGYLIGQVFSNTAKIYFDFNDPIITNTVLTEIKDFTASISPVSGFNSAANFTINPNPANDRLIITSSGRINDGIIRLFSSSGALVYSVNWNGKQVEIPVSNFTDGLYLVQLGEESKKVMIAH